MGAASLKRPAAVCSAGQYQRAAAQSKATTRLSTTSKRKTLERVATAEAPGTLNRTDRNKADMTLRKARKRRSTDRSLHNTAVSADPSSGAFVLAPILVSEPNNGTHEIPSIETQTACE